MSITYNKSISNKNQIITISVSHYFKCNPLIVNEIYIKKYTIEKRMLYLIVPNEKEVIKQSIIIISHKWLRDEKR